ncbi:MAG: hypothetical protein KTR25_20420 [Myxococcales bacterium]|nr:hypothetical protein [Myxococcales bacterium]
MFRLMSRHFQRLHHDQEGQILPLMIVSLFICVVFAAAVINTGQHINERQLIQTSVDAGTYSSAATMAKGMNAIALTNIILEILQAILVVFALISIVLGIAILGFSACCAAIVSSAFCCPAVASLESFRRSFDRVRDGVERAVKSVMNVVQNIASVINRIANPVATGLGIFVGRQGLPSPAPTVITFPVLDALPTEPKPKRCLCEHFGNRIDETIRNELSRLGFFAKIVASAASSSAEVICNNQSGKIDFGEIFENTVGNANFEGGSTDCQECIAKGDKLTQAIFRTQPTNSSVTVDETRVFANGTTSTRRFLDPNRTPEELGIVVQGERTRSFLGSEAQRKLQCTPFISSHTSRPRNRVVDNVRISTVRTSPERLDFFKCIFELDSEVDFSSENNTDQRNSDLPSPRLLINSECGESYSELREEGRFNIFGLAFHRVSDAQRFMPRIMGEEGNTNYLAVAKAEFYSTGSGDLWSMDWKARLIRVTLDEILQTQNDIRNQDFSESTVPTPNAGLLDRVQSLERFPEIRNLFHH